jgi:hypothetical protein
VSSLRGRKIDGSACEDILVVDRMFQGGGKLPLFEMPLRDFAILDGIGCILSKNRQVVYGLRIEPILGGLED